MLEIQADIDSESKSCKIDVQKKENKSYEKYKITNCLTVDIITSPEIYN